MSVETVPDVLRQGGGKPILDAEGNAIPVMVEKVVFRAAEPFEGIKTEYLEVYGSGTTCDYHFNVGNRYLVYGWLGDDGKICTAKCTRTAPLREAKQDLKFLHSLKKQHTFNFRKNPLYINRGVKQLAALRGFLRPFLPPRF